MAGRWGGGKNSDLGSEHRLWQLRRPRGKDPRAQTHLTASLAVRLETQAWEKVLRTCEALIKSRLN